MISIYLLSLALAATAGSPAQAAREETVRFASDSVTIVGTLALPAGAKPPLPAIVLLHGSEAGGRDERFFRPLRERLTAAGMAVLSYDRRGVGESGGHYVETPDLRVPARDALSAVRFLAGRDEIDRGRIGLLGISQGGWAAPLAATLAPGVAFVVAISGPGVSPLEQSAYQCAAELTEAGLSAAAADSATTLRRVLYRYWHGDVARANAEAAWEVARGRTWLSQAAKNDRLYSRIATLSTVPLTSDLPPDFQRALNEHFFYDPIPVAERLHSPVLHLFGAADRHVFVEESVAALRSAYARSGHPDATIRVLAHTGHAMQRVRGVAECLHCPPGAREPWEPAPGWLDTLTTWLDARGLR